ncbi:flagellar brake protein [Ideonella dechloratans]|uniref:flagellar brake protein n=1 Tax=Ideonella dechloratans TaxID=36863 RepID=UPI0035B21379
MFSDTQPAPLDLAGDASLADFRITDAVEIRALLKALMERSTLVNLCGADGSAYGTTLWNLDTHNRKVAFTVDMMAPTVQRLVESEEVTAVAYLDQIKIQFDVGSRLLVHGARTCVLQAAMPRELFRFQRRASFRVRTLERSAPTASFRHPQMPEIRMDLRVLDVSIGGCALFLPADLPMVEPGIQVRGVQMALEPDTQFPAQLNIAHVTAIHPQAKGVRLGCEFRGLDHEAQRALQRYIDATQKRRRMLSLD